MLCHSHSNQVHSELFSARRGSVCHYMNERHGLLIKPASKYSARMLDAQSRRRNYTNQRQCSLRPTMTPLSAFRNRSLRSQQTAYKPMQKRQIKSNRVTKLFVSGTCERLVVAALPNVVGATFYRAGYRGTRTVRQQFIRYYGTICLVQKQCHG